MSEKQVVSRHGSLMVYQDLLVATLPLFGDGGVSVRAAAGTFGWRRWSLPICATSWWPFCATAPLIRWSSPTSRSGPCWCCFCPPA